MKSWLKRCLHWRKAIVHDLLTLQVPIADADQMAQQWIHALLCLYLAEQRGILVEGQVRSLQHAPNPAQQLIQLWQTIHEVYGCLLDEPFSNAALIADVTARSILNDLYNQALQQPGLAIEILGYCYEQGLNPSVSPPSPPTLGGTSLQSPPILGDLGG